MALAISKCKSVAVAEIGDLKLLVKHRISCTLGYLTTKLREKDIAIAKTAKSGFIDCYFSVTTMTAGLAPLQLPFNASA